MSKLYEEFIRINIDNLKPFDKELKGELTIVISERVNNKKVHKNSVNQIKEILIK